MRVKEGIVGAAANLHGLHAAHRALYALVGGVVVASRSDGCELLVPNGRMVAADPGLEEERPGKPLTFKAEATKVTRRRSVGDIEDSSGDSIDLDGRLASRILVSSLRK